MFAPNIVSLIIFILAYLFFIFQPKKRTFIAILGALLLILLRAISWQEAFLSVNWNVMGIFVGMLLVADVLVESRVPAYLAEVIVDKAKNTTWAILFICILTSFISVFVENVATVLIIAPVALALAKKIKLNPVSLLIAIAVSSNLQGAATLIGDPPSMLLGGFAKMSFFDFFFYHGKLSVFFAVETGALFSFFVLYYFFRKHTAKPVLLKIEKVKSWMPTVILVITIILLAIVSFVKPGFSSVSGILCLTSGMISMLWNKYRYNANLLKSLRSLDWDSTFFLISIFILVGGITVNGWIEILSTSLSGLIGSNIFLGYTLLVFLSVFLSAFIDNVPYLAAMLPLAISMSSKIGIDPSLLLFGLLIGASLGGNITPIGASANIVALSLLKKEGYDVKFREFVKIGLPFTIAAVAAAYLFVWIVWKK